MESIDTKPIIKEPISIFASPIFTNILFLALLIISIIYIIWKILLHKMEMDQLKKISPVKKTKISKKYGKNQDYKYRKKYSKKFVKKYKHRGGTYTYSEV